MGNPSDITKIKTETKPKDINFDLDYLIKKTSPNEKPIKNIDSETLDFNVENMLNKPQEVENKPGHITHMNEGIHRPKEEVPNVTPSTSSSDVLAKEGEIVHIDLGKISTSAKGALNGEFVNKSKLNKPSWENNNLLYKIRDDGAVAIFHEGVIIGFTTQDAIKGENVENINLTSHPTDNQGISDGVNNSTSYPSFNQGISNIKEDQDVPNKRTNININDNSSTEILEGAAKSININDNYTVHEGIHNTIGNRTYKLSQDELNKVAFVIQKEAGDGGSYEEALSVASVIMNRLEYDGFASNTEILPLLTPDQFTPAGYVGFNNNDINSSTTNPNVLKAINDCFNNGIRNNDYLFFNNHLEGGIKLNPHGNEYKKLIDIKYLDRINK